MNSKTSFKTIAGFLKTGSNKVSRFFGYAGLCLGMLLLLLSSQMIININALVKEKNIRKNGYDFVSITKKITNENMAKDNRFIQKEVEELRKQPFVEDAAPLVSNQFRAKASAGTIVPFSTDLFLEAIKNDFIDTLPPSFTWEPGQVNVPIIFSADYLEMYNVFAPSQDLPQLSEKTISSLSVILECYGNNGIEKFRGNIVAVSNRISSVLVPENFLAWANERFANSKNVPAARIYIKTKDANNTAFIRYLDGKNYQLNKEKIKLGRMKQVFEGIMTALASFAIIVIVLAMLLFSFYLQLMIEKSKQNLSLLVILGYSPRWLSKTIAKRWVPVYLLITIAAIALTSLFQWYFVSINFPSLSLLIHPYVLGIALLIFLVSIFTNYRMIRNILYKL